jgi:hypothetical protein
MTPAVFDEKNQAVARTTVVSTQSSQRGTRGGPVVPADSCDPGSGEAGTHEVESQRPMRGRLDQGGHNLCTMVIGAFV